MSLEDDGGADGAASCTLTSLWVTATGPASSTLRAAPMGASASAMLPDVDHIRQHPRPWKHCMGSREARARWQSGCAPSADGDPPGSLGRLPWWPGPSVVSCKTISFLGLKRKREPFQLIPELYSLFGIVHWHWTLMTLPEVGCLPLTSSHPACHREGEGTQAQQLDDQITIIGECLLYYIFPLLTSSAWKGDCAYGALLTARTDCSSLRPAIADKFSLCTAGSK